MNNVVTRQRAPLNKEVKAYHRYSNGTVVDTGNMFQQLPGSDDYSNLSDAPSSGSSSSSFDWGSILNNFINGTTSVLNSMFGRSDAYKAQAYESMYKESQRTNTVLWVIIGLIVALGVVLVLRKTK